METTDIPLTVKNISRVKEYTAALWFKSNIAVIQGKKSLFTVTFQPGSRCRNLHVYTSENGSNYYLRYADEEVEEKIVRNCRNFVSLIKKKSILLVFNFVTVAEMCLSIFISSIRVGLSGINFGSITYWPNTHLSPQSFEGFYSSLAVISICPQFPWKSFRCMWHSKHMLVRKMFSN